MLSVIALGIFMGKQMFRLMEAGSSPSVPGSQATHPPQTQDNSNVKVLYSSDGKESGNPVQAVSAEEITSDAGLPVVARGVSAAVTGQETKADPASATGPVFDPKGPKWYAYASGNGTNVRTGPSTSEKLLFKVGKGTRGVVTEKRDGWTSIKWDFNRKTGWVRDDLLLQGPATVMVNLLQKSDDSGKIDTNEVAKAAAQQAIKENLVSVAIAKPAPASETVNTYVQGQPLPEQGTIEAQTFANIRSEPNTTSEKVGKLPKGMMVKIKATKQVGKWRWFEVIFNEGRKTGWTREDNLKF